MPLLPADTAAPAPAPTEGLTDAGPKKAKKGRPYNNRKKTAERSADLHQGIKAIKDASKAQAVKLANDLAMYVPCSLVNGADIDERSKFALAGAPFA